MPVSKHLQTLVNALKRYSLRTTCPEVLPNLLSGEQTGCAISQMQFLDLYASLKNDTRLATLLDKYMYQLKGPHFDLSKAQLVKLSRMSRQQGEAFLEKHERAVLNSSKDMGDYASRQEYMDELLERIMKLYARLLTPKGRDAGSYYCSTLVKIMGSSMRGWKLVRYLGGGDNGKVFLMIDPRGTQRAVKVSLEGDDIREEARAQNQFYAHGLTVKVHSIKKIRMAGRAATVIVMDPVQYTLTEALCMMGDDTRKIADLARNVVALLTRMRTLRLTHGDMHPDNIALVRRGGETRMVLIDFGVSSTDHANTVLDIEQFLRVLSGPEFLQYKHSHIFVDHLNKFMARAKIQHTISGKYGYYFKKFELYEDKMNVLSNRERGVLVEKIKRAVSKGRG